MESCVINAFDVLLSVCVFAECFVKRAEEHRNALGWMVKLGWTQSLGRKRGKRGIVSIF